jgi:hypothetical protein
LKRATIQARWFTTERGPGLGLICQSDSAKRRLHKGIARGDVQAEAERSAL